MHGLDVIIRRNAEVAGREAAHARNDGDTKRSQAIGRVDVIRDLGGPMDEMQIAANRAWCVGYRRGLQEN